MVGIFQMFGFSFVIWSFMGILRFIFETVASMSFVRQMNALPRDTPSRIRPDEVAVLIAAHNEELTIESTIESVKSLTAPTHIYVVSDGSNDKTVEVSRNTGCTVDDLQPNRGKARALVYMLRKHNLYDRYKAVMIMDADLKVSSNYFDVMLAEFDDPRVAASVSRAIPLWPQHIFPRLDMLVTAYRVQIWRILQFCIRYGQTWKYMNVTPIIPGGSSIYRTSVLRQIEIDAPNLIIEDFNMTFEVHHKKLGRISYCWNANVIDQEPFSIRDFTKQIYRWYLGFWQTVRRHGPWFSFFWSTMIIFAIELGISSLVFLGVPLLVLASIVQYVMPTAPLATLIPDITLYEFLITLIALEYIVTIFLAFFEKKPLMLVYGIFFFPLRYIESAVLLYTMFLGLFRRPSADGRWISPKRVALHSAS